MMHVFPDDLVVEPEVGSRQWIFDRVVRHHRRQQARCPPEGRCFYRFAGAMCFAGALIDEESYRPEMEGHYVRDLVKLFRLPAWFLDNIELIADLQRLHDTASSWTVGMDTALEIFAAERGLAMPD